MVHAGFDQFAVVVETDPVDTDPVAINPADVVIALVALGADHRRTMNRIRQTMARITRIVTSIVSSLYGFSAARKPITAIDATITATTNPPNAYRPAFVFCRSVVASLTLLRPWI